VKGKGKGRKKNFNLLDKKKKNLGRTDLRSETPDFSRKVMV
jgi:hypothetical protein